MRFLPLLLLVVSLACTRGEAPTARPDVVIWLVDTVRADRLSAYGHGRPTTPRLEEFTADATLFETAYTPSSWTRAAIGSLFTGLVPPRHGSVTLVERLPDDAETMAGRLKAVGYTTVAIVGNPVVGPIWGFGKGFDRFVSIGLKTKGVKNNSDVVYRAVEKELANPPKEPLFLYIHTMDPHGPVQPPEPWRSKWSSGGSPPPPDAKTITPETPPEVIREMLAAYDGAIAFNDLHFGMLVDRLRKLGRYDGALFVYASDHGEEYQDHGSGAHAHSLYEELVRVPLVVKWPKARHAKQRVATPVSLLDVLPTVLAEAGVRVPEELDGFPLEAAFRETDTPRPFLFHLNFQRGSGIVNSLAALRLGNFKYIDRLLPKPEQSLFDLASDPFERTNLLTSRSDLARDIARRLDEELAGAESGIYLRLVNGADETVRRFTGRFETTGRFRGVRGTQLEQDDAVIASDDGRSISFRVESRNVPNPMPRIPKKLVDEDVVRFQVDPPDATVELVELSADGFPERPLFLGAAKEAAPATGPVRVDVARLAVKDPSGLLPAGREWSVEAPGGAYLFTVPQRRAAEVAPDEEMTEQLRSLGYVQ